jgi:hypothetical protein
MTGRDSMSREPKYIKEFKKFASGNPNIGDLPKLEAEVYGTNDRARAVMLASIVEISLEIFLRNNTRPTLNADDTRLLFDYRGPLGDFAAKILVGYAFNLYGQNTRHDMDLIRVLRNGFAHSRISFDFTTPTVANVCAQLRAPDEPGAFIPHGWLSAASHDDVDDAGNNAHPRTRYVATCHIISERLFSNAERSPHNRPRDMP